MESHLIILVFPSVITIYSEQTREKKPRETILRAEFAKAIDYINKSLPEDSRLRFLHWDLHKYSRKYAASVSNYLTVLYSVIKIVMMFKICTKSN